MGWSPDGVQVGGGGDDGKMHVWDATDGTQQAELKGHQGVITSVAWSPDGTRLASSGRVRGSGEMLVWDVQSGERVRALAGDSGVVYAVTWGSNSELLVSGGSDGMLGWWDVQSGEGVRV